MNKKNGRRVTWTDLNVYKNYFQLIFFHSEIFSRQMLFRLRCQLIKRYLHLQQTNPMIMWTIGVLVEDTWTVQIWWRHSKYWRKLHQNCIFLQLGVVSIAIALGIIMSTMREKVNNLVCVILEFTQVMMGIIQIVIWMTPIGVYFLILAKFLEMSDILDVFTKLGMYLATVSAGIFIHGFIILPLVYLLFTRKNPIIFIGHMMPAILTALGTSSSLATLPVSIKCLEENAKVDVRVSRFMLPLGATINMNGMFEGWAWHKCWYLYLLLNYQTGTALYEAVAAIFIAQLRHVDLSIGNVIAVW